MAGARRRDEWEGTDTQDLKFVSLFVSKRLREIRSDEFGSEMVKPEGSSWDWGSEHLGCVHR